MTTESCGLMNLGQLGFRLSLKNAKPNCEFGNCHNTKINDSLLNYVALTINR